MVVHHVKMNQVRTRCDHGAYFVAQAREIGGQNGWRDLVRAGVARQWNLNQNLSNLHESTMSRYSVTVNPTPFYLADQSDPANDLYTFAYHISIKNDGEVRVQLLSRHWIITDGHGKVQEVRGAGVIGEQPEIAPGESYEYTSGSQFKTAVGTMHGSYQFVADDGVKFDAPIPKFTLAAKRVLH
jgi:ApaG protein